MQLSYPKVILVAFAIPAFFCVAMAVIGGINNYTPVPLSDMWSEPSYVLKLQQNNLSDWFNQHNEHRIFLTRCLFWVDYVLLGGRGIFLEVVNYLLLLGIYLSLYRCLSERLVAEENNLGKYILALLMMTCEFSWLQQENLVWNFQSQFFLAQLLPLLAFYCLHKAHTDVAENKKYFSLASLLGVFALGSMANGVLTLPLLTVLAALLGMGWRRIGILLVLTVLALTVYFYDYHAPPAHGSLKNAFLYQPLELIKYILLYLGGPFYFITGKINFLVAQAAGLFLIITTSVFAWRSLQRPKQHSLVLALLMFIAYIGGSALATAGGRLIFGIPQALAGRYSTPTIMAWSILLILFAPVLVKKIHSYSKFFLSTLAFVQLLFLTNQIGALESKSLQNLDYMVAILAVELGIDDSQQIQKIFPNSQFLLTQTTAAREQNIGIFGNPLVKDARQIFTQSEKVNAQNSCLGRVDNYERLKGSEFIRLSGWVFNLNTGTSPKIIHLLNQQGNVIGIGLTGWERDDLVQQLDPRATSAGFKGYVLDSYVGQDVVFNGVDSKCVYKTNINLSREDIVAYQLGTLAEYLDIREDKDSIFSKLSQSSNLGIEAIKLSTLSDIKLAEAKHSSPVPCALKINEYSQIINDPRYVRITGQIEYPTLKGISENLHILNSEAKVVGYSISHGSFELAGAGNGNRFALQGYLLASQIGKPLVIEGLQSGCSAQAEIAALPFYIKPVSSSNLKSVLSGESIVGQNNWLGSDSAQTKIEGYHVWGSYIHSDKDVGGISLRLKRGDIIFYRSGPTYGNQLLEMEGRADPIVLPVATEWVVLEFSDVQLPSLFTVKLIDQGKDWGEWSAIGLRDNKKE